MLVTLCFWLWPLLGLPLTHATTINVIPFSDASIYYSPGWSQEFSDSAQTSYMQADGFDCYLSVTLPSNASSVSYVGFKRAGGSMYGYTLDCDTDCLLQTVNATDPTVTDDANAPESTLFTVALDPSTQHTLYVLNILSNLGDGSSEINLSNLNVAVDDVSSSIQPVSNTVIPPLPTSSAGPTSSAQTSTSATPTSASSSASAILGSSNSVTATPTSGVNSPSGATSTGSATGSSVAGSQSPSVPVPPIASSSLTPNGTANASGASNSNGGGSSPRTVAIGVGVLGGIFGVCVIVALIAFIRQRRRKRRNTDPESSSSSSSSSLSGPRPPLSPTGSLIPIMPPPQMRQTSELYTIPNPFMDPPSEPPSEAPSLDMSHSDISHGSSYTQRRMEARTSPGSPASPAPTIPLPDIPRATADGRSHSPSIASFARSDLWITRSPSKPSFSSLV
ncbi:hypothetical protein MSAN_02184300 [Mycena sanguinolenta]|uniref:Uncharacterized protein n=1 Tax=Mycena sanguinolenta TaxID=230812 RepID=A0A8H6XEN1_9AGAR|nr:hypothetical protein MSAN_02184300 [Mycena sanguinolenta]